MNPLPSYSKNGVKSTPAVDTRAVSPEVTALRIAKEGTTVLSHHFGTLVILLLTFVLLSARGGLPLEVYPFLVPDSYDWLVNGLAYSRFQERLDISHRPPLLPLIFALLFASRNEFLIPLLGTLTLGAGLLGIQRQLTHRVPRTIAVLTVILWGSSAFIVAQSAFIAADLAATMLFTGGVLALLPRQTVRKRHGILTALTLLALSAHTQYIAFALTPTLLIAYLFGQRLSAKVLEKPHGSVHRVLGHIVVAAAVIVPLLPRVLVHGVLYTEKVQHLSLVTVSLAGIPYYLLGFISAFSLPSVILATIGIFSGLTNRELRPLALVFVVWLLNCFSFFAFLYSWLDIRFLIYLSFPAAFFTAVGIVSIWNAAQQGRSFLRWLTQLTALGLAGITVLASASGASSSPYSTILVFSPRHVFFFDERGAISRTAHSVQLYLLRHLRELAEWRKRLQSEEIDEQLVSTPLAALLRRLQKTARERAGKGVVFYDEMEPDRYYIEKNRVILYYRGKIETINREALLCSRLAAEPVLLITTTSQVLRKPCELEHRKLVVSDQSGPYVVVEVDPTQITRQSVPES